MQAIRQIVERKKVHSIFIPEEFGEKVEVIILPVRQKEDYPNWQLMAMIQEDTGFVSEILADKEEDVWNEL